ncbi:ribonuclease H family protein [Rhodococcus pyridinivorans]|uniref:ribonuclease H family protein n=1 Tax=Rhodococcus pyridinivorans TaxID=103816 RepID=UPI00110DBA21|nr:ribonuclease H family protein [Rhodococcus pyridinivorans]
MMNAPTPLQIRNRPLTKTPADALTAAVRVVDRHDPDGACHRLIVALMLDADTPVAHFYADTRSSTSDTAALEILNAFAEIYSHAEAHHRDVLVYIGDAFVRRHLRAESESFPLATFATNLYDALGSRLIPVYERSATVADQWRSDLALAHIQQIERARREHLVIYTDGSVSSNHPGCGMGVVTRNGEVHAHFDAQAPNDPLVAELLAIELAVQTYPLQRLTIRTDSLNAIALLNMDIDEINNRARHGDYRTDLYINYVAKRIVRAITDRRVSFEWVKGHDGDLHNEAADRAARSVRRYNTYRIPPSALSHVLDNIRQDIAA